VTPRYCETSLRVETAARDEESIARICSRSARSSNNNDARSPDANNGVRLSRSMMRLAAARSSAVPPVSDMTGSRMGRVAFATSSLGHAYHETCAEASFGNGSAVYSWEAVSRILTFARAVSVGSPPTCADKRTADHGDNEQQDSKPPNRQVRIGEWRFLCGPTCLRTLERPEGSAPKRDANRK
jgi:hypothetical protein